MHRRLRTILSRAERQSQRMLRSRSQVLRAAPATRNQPPSRAVSGAPRCGRSRTALLPRCHLVSRCSRPPALGRRAPPGRRSHLARRRENRAHRAPRSRVPRCPRGRFPGVPRSQASTTPWHQGVANHAGRRLRSPARQPADRECPARRRCPCDPPAALRRRLNRLAHPLNQTCQRTRRQTCTRCQPESEATAPVRRISRFRTADRTHALPLGPRRLRPRTLPCPVVRPGHPFLLRHQSWPLQRRQKRWRICLRRLVL